MDYLVTHFWTHWSDITGIDGQLRWNTQILQNQSGVSEIHADPGVHRVIISVDAAQVNRDAVLAALEQGGYPAQVVGDSH